MMSTRYCAVFGFSATVPDEHSGISAGVAHADEPPT
jgi:hypothetical protein